MSVKDRSRLLEFNYHVHRPSVTLLNLADRSAAYYLWVLLVFIIKQSPAWVLPIITGKAIDVLSDPSAEAMRNLMVYALIGFVLVVQNIPMHTYFIRMLSGTVRRMEQRLRLALVTRLQHLSFAFHDRTEGGRLQAKVLRDVEQIQGMCMYIGEIATMGLTTIVFCVVLTLLKEPLMLMTYVVLVPLCIGLIRLFKGSIRRRNQSFRNNIESMSAEVTQMIGMIPVARAHGVEEQALDRITREVQSVSREGHLLDRINAVFQSSSWVTFQMALLVGLGVGFWFCYNGRISVGDVVLFQALFTQIVGSVNMLTNAYPQIARGMESVRSIGEVLECPDLELNEGKRAVSEVKGAVKYQNVSFGFGCGDDPVVRDFNLEVNPGECIALVGPSGAGKSTVVNLTIGFRRPTGGRILLDGNDMEQLDMRQWRRHISVVPQQSLMFAGTVRDNITFGMQQVDPVLLERIIKATHVDEFVARLPHGLDSWVGEGGASLSGGQRQRLAIARALIREPKIIFLDEATSALDVESEHFVQAALEELIAGRTTFIVAHRLSTIRRADRIVVMQDGRIVETGSYDELMARNGVFKRMRDLSNA